MQFHHLHKGVNTGDDAAMSYKNLVNFGAVTLIITFLYEYLHVVIGRKSAYDLRSLCRHFLMRWTIEMSMGAYKAAIGMCISYKFGGLLSGTSTVNAAQLCTAINQSAVELIHLRSPGSSTFVFRYYLLGGDTAMLGRLYAWHCHACLVFSFMQIMLSDIDQQIYIVGWAPRAKFAICDCLMLVLRLAHTFRKDWTRPNAWSPVLVLLAPPGEYD